MPTHKIHLAIAKKANEHLKMDLDSIMLGSVLPDICIEKNHTLSHYQNGKLGIEGTANPDLFVANHKNDLNNPTVLGYLIHLLTDKFYNTYAFNKFYIYDKDGKEIGIHLKNKDKYTSPSEIKNYKHREFYLYDRWLLNNGYVPKFENFDCLNNIINLKEATFDKNKLKEYILSSNKDIDKINFLTKIRLANYKLTTKKELDKQFKLCCDYIIEYIENLK